MEDHEQVNFKSIRNLKSWLDKQDKTLVFAMNAGMYKQDNSPQGLFIENIKTLTPLDTTSGKGNFYLNPNGFFLFRLTTCRALQHYRFYRQRKTKVCNPIGTNVDN